MASCLPWVCSWPWGRAARASSFNCNRAHLPDEIAICRTPELAELDNTIAVAYAYLKSTRGRGYADQVGVPSKPFRALWPRADDRHEIRDRARRSRDRRSCRYRLRPRLPLSAGRGQNRVRVSPRELYRAGLGAAARPRLVYVYPVEFRKLIINGMRYDYSWNSPGATRSDISPFLSHA